MMFISQALAHGASGADSPGGFGPFILLAVAVIFVLALVGEKKWRAYQQRRNGGAGKQNPMNGKSP